MKASDLIKKKGDKDTDKKGVGGKLIDWIGKRRHGMKGADKEEK